MARVAVFCDGDFWHGRNWRRLKAALQRRANATYWVPKIAANRARDQRTRSEIRRQGWHVIRVWETDVNKDPNSVAMFIRDHVRDRHHS
jgi:DNA mismatch endonuclease (patch repair protein)